MARSRFTQKVRSSRPILTVPHQTSPDEAGCLTTRLSFGERPVLSPEYAIKARGIGEGRARFVQEGLLIQHRWCSVSVYRVDVNFVLAEIKHARSFRLHFRALNAQSHLSSTNSAPTRNPRNTIRGDCLVDDGGPRLGLQPNRLPRSRNLILSPRDP